MSVVAIQNIAWFRWKQSTVLKYISTRSKKSLAQNIKSVLSEKVLCLRKMATMKRISKSLTINRRHSMALTGAIKYSKNTYYTLARRLFNYRTTI